MLLAVLLFALWLLMSGVYKPLVISLGAISSVLCVWVVHRLDILGARNVVDDIKIISLTRYLFWLTVEIGKEDWAVTKVILSPEMKLQQRLMRFLPTQNSDFGKMIFANSITITPGTVTVDTQEDCFVVHALTDEAADEAGLAQMSARVSALERQSG